jgi:hypothetical protein
MTDEGLPTPSDSLFAEGNRAARVDLQFLKQQPMTLSFIEGYRVAAEAVIQGFLDTHEWYRDDAMFLPVAYLYRHYLELSLKWHIETGIVWNLVPKKSVKGHSLWALWERARPVVEIIWSSVDHDVLQGAENIIRQMHKVDETGQEMRYALDNEDKPTLQKAPDNVDLIHLRDTMAKMHRFFTELNVQSQSWFNARSWEEFQSTMKNR